MTSPLRIPTTIASTLILYLSLMHNLFFSFLLCFQRLRFQHVFVLAATNQALDRLLDKYSTPSQGQDASFYRLELLFSEGKQKLGHNAAQSITGGRNHDTTASTMKCSMQKYVESQKSYGHYLVYIYFYADDSHGYNLCLGFNRELLCRKIPFVLCDAFTIVTTIHSPGCDPICALR